MSPDSLDQGGLPWFAIQVWAGRERQAAMHLGTRGFTVFYPCYQERRRWSDRVKVTSLALFGGYLFCQSEPHAVGKVMMAPTVIRVVGDGRVPIAVPSPHIEAIRRIVETRLPVEPWNGIQAGQPVRVESGPLRGLEGIVLMVRNRHRLVVSIPMLERSVAVEIDVASVVAIGGVGSMSGLPAGGLVPLSARRRLSHAASQ
jgi:transcription antitermination factor NusG